MDTLKKVFAKKLLDIKAIKLQPNDLFTWASGWKSPFYCDNRKTLSFPELRNFVKLQLVHAVMEHFPQAITKEMNRFIKESTDNQGDAWGIIGNIISQKIVGVVVDNLIEVDNYGVCSVGSITFKGKTHRVSFGILGHVFTFDADDIQRALENGGDASDIFHSPLNNPGDNDSSSDDGSTDEGSSDNGSSTDDGGSSYDQQDGSADDGQSNGSSDSNEADGSDMSNM